MNEKVLKILTDGSKDYFSLTDFEQDIFLLASLINSAEGEGVASFYAGVGGAYHERLLELLNELRLDEAAFVIDSIGAIFPDGCPSEDDDERKEILAELTEDYWDLFAEWNDQILEFIKELKSALDTMTAK